MPSEQELADTADLSRDTIFCGVLFVAVAMVMFFLTEDTGRWSVPATDGTIVITYDPWLLRGLLLGVTGFGLAMCLAGWAYSRRLPGSRIAILALTAVIGVIVIATLIQMFVRFANQDYGSISSTVLILWLLGGYTWRVFKHFCRRRNAYDPNESIG